MALLRTMTPRSFMNLMWLSLQNVLSTFADNIYSNWIPLFLSQVHGLKFAQMGLYSALPLLAEGPVKIRQLHCPSGRSSRSIWLDPGARVRTTSTMHFSALAAPAAPAATSAVVRGNAPIERVSLPAAKPPTTSAVAERTVKIG